MMYLSDTRPHNLNGSWSASGKHTELALGQETFLEWYRNQSTVNVHPFKLELILVKTSLSHTHTQNTSANNIRDGTRRQIQNGLFSLKSEICIFVFALVIGSVPSVV